MLRVRSYRNFIVACLVGVVLSGCAAASTAISKRNLDVQTKMSSTIFLEPVKPALKTVFLQVRNTSDKSDFDVSQEISSAIIGKGYKIVDDPDAAHFLVQANILQVGKNDPTAAEKAFGNGYGDIAGGVAAGAVIGAHTSRSYGGGIVGGIVGGAGSLIANNLVKDVYYSVITDLQISERAKKGQKVVNRSKHNLAQGNSGSTVSMTEEVNDRKRYQTRILSSANKANLEWHEASPALVRGLVRSISGIL